MADHIAVINAIERNHILKLLENGQRLDGRSLDEFRDIKIETNVIGTAHGSAIVHMGKTKVICGVKGVVSSPWADYPNKGSLYVGFEASPLSAPQFRLGPPQINEIEIARMTDRSIRESECVNLEDLCIIEGDKVWILNIDLYAMDDFGNMFDACVIAAYAALATTKIPTTEVVDGEVKVLDERRPIKLDSFPVSVTTYKINEHTIVDAELREQQVGDARITFGTTENFIVSGQKGENGSFKSAEIVEILKKSIVIANNIREDIRSQLNQ